MQRHRRGARNAGHTHAVTGRRGHTSTRSRAQKIQHRDPPPVSPTAGAVSLYLFLWGGPLLPDVQKY
eukprot:8324234-Karenia_brevis.AAC.1